MKFEEQLFREAESNWDLEKLYTKLNQVKQLDSSKTAKLTETEKAILRGFLCGYSPQEIASYLHWTICSLRVELTRGLYRYIETLTEHQLNTIKNWRNIPQWLAAAGYNSPQLKQNWSQLPSIGNFYGRKKELAQLEQKIIQEKYQLITLLGMAGIGKTALTVKFARQNTHQFKYVIWRSLRHAPLLEDFLTDLLKFFAPNNIPTTINGRITLLIKYLRSSRCLVIIDGLETILGVNHLAGFYQEKYSNYQQLIKQIAEVSHQSCLLITSQDEPMDMLFIQGNKVDSIPLGSLGDAAKEILNEKALSDSYCWQKLIERYGGNPLALKLVSTTIKELFGASVAEFLGTNTELEVIVPIPLQKLLRAQFQRLSNLEKRILFTLATNRQPKNLQQLQKHFNPEISMSKLLPTMTSLKKRSLIEVIYQSNQVSFTLQPMIMKYLLAHQKTAKTSKLNPESDNQESIKNEVLGEL